MHPSLWTASSTNTIKKDSFKSRSSSSGLNSLYTTFNIQEPARANREDNVTLVSAATTKQAVFTLESLFGSSQNTSLDGESVGTDASGACSERGARRSTGNQSDRRRRKSESQYRGSSAGSKRHTNLYGISTNSSNIQNVDAINFTGCDPRVNPRVAEQRGPPSAAGSLPYGDGTESIPEDKSSNFEDFPCDLRSLASTCAESKRKTYDTISISTNYSQMTGSYVSAQYSRKWRVCIALLVGGVLIALCLLGFYLNAESRRAEYLAAAKVKEEVSSSGETDDELAVVGEEKIPPESPALEKSSSWPKSEAEVEANAKWRMTKGSCEYIDLHCPEGYEPPIVLLIGIDGLRNDMITPRTAPALHHLAKCGVWASHLTPVYPTDTFTNLYTIVTGLYPESHGIIGSHIYDASRNKTLRIGKYESIKQNWWAGDPVWNTIQNRGLRSAMYYWPGASVQVNGRSPTIEYKYRNDYPLETGVNKIKEWLLLEPEDRPSLLGLYFDNPNKVIKEAGIYTKRANDSLLEVDHQIDRLMTALHEMNVTSCVDIVVVSDHGVAPSSCANSLYLETFMEKIDHKARVITGAVGRLQAIEGKGSNEEILNQLRCKNRKLRALSKDVLPNRYHYANNERIEGVILDTLPGNRIVTSDTNYCKKAEHGFNNIDPLMQGIFFARGPSFKANYKFSGFRNVEIYNLLTRLLGTKASPNNGTEGSLYHILRDPPPPPTIRINAWPENVLSFLHPRSRDPSFLEELKVPPTEPTISSSPPSTTMVTPISTEMMSSTSIENKADSLNDDAGVESSSISTSTTPSISSPIPIDTHPVEDKAVENKEQIPASTTSRPTVSTSEPLVQSSTKATSTSDQEQSEVVSDAADDGNGETKQILESSLSQREGKTVDESSALVKDLQPTAGVESPIPNLTLSSVVTPLAEGENSRDTPEDNGNAVSNSSIVLDKEIAHNSQVNEDLMEVGERSSVDNTMKNGVKNETLLEDKESSTTSPSISVNVSIASTAIVSEVSPSATTDSLSSEQGVQTSSSVSPILPTATTLTTGSSNILPSSTESNVQPTATNLSASDNFEQKNDSLSSLTNTQTTNPQPENAPQSNITNESTNPVTESMLTNRKKRNTCECTSSKDLQQERGRGQPARSDHIAHHCPFGAPQFEAREAPRGTHYILPYTNHINGYIGELGTAIWSSFTLTNSTLDALEMNPLANSTDFGGLSDSPCWLADPRLPRDPDQQCMEYLLDRYNTDVVSMHQLFPQEFEAPEVLAREGYFLTNAIALRKGFTEGGRHSIVGLLREWTRSRNVVNVVTGPVWDRNYNGRGDTIIHIRSLVDFLTPSHVFYIVSSCKTSAGFDLDETDLRKCASDELDVLAFVFPNTKLNDNCQMNDREYSRYHLTSLTDIERLTGLQFFSGFIGESSLPVLLAEQPLELWDD
ncbi:uncharacterized protein LOC108679668 isoform X2 [Hyalella azteca]|uniref:Uncharacterized protein LOC108679668 isoform X2 n=1 Tax=Hyalella azteca TaxID=294128 RepID=A0A8B7PCM9_HYAAZ|nr:uncharacterized protein LOC108679668 isoform X2 [Hyalella azteca]